MKIEKIFEGLNIEPVQDRKKGGELWNNYELFTYDDVIIAMNAVKNLELMVVNHQIKPLVCNRINDNNSNRCITCGVKAGHNCALI
jgi:hypothetical protein